MKRFLVIIILALAVVSCSPPKLSVDDFRLSDIKFYDGYAYATLTVDLPRPLPHAACGMAQLIVGADTMMIVNMREPRIIPAHARQVALPIRIKLVKPFAMMMLISGPDRDILLRVNATARIGRREIETFAFDHTVRMDDLREAVKNYLDKR